MEQTLLDLAGVVLEKDINHMDRYRAWQKLGNGLTALDGVNWLQFSDAERRKMLSALDVFGFGK